MTRVVVIDVRVGPAQVSGRRQSRILDRKLSDYEEVLEERSGLDDAPITPEVISLAVDLQHRLA